MINEVILASTSGIRLKILQDNKFKVKQISPGVDEDEVNAPSSVDVTAPAVVPPHTPNP